MAEIRLEPVRVEFPEGCNVVFGITHFIKSIEDIYEAIINTVPGAKFGVAFAEASGPCLIRHEGTDEELRRLAAENLLRIGCGHTFLIILRNLYPINILGRLKEVPEVCTILAATANPLTVIVAETDQGEGKTGRGVVAVIDGYKSRGIEESEDIKHRREFLRKIGYKF
jgi:adenosine/AMP kinase